MGRSATLLVVLAVAALSVASVATSASITSTEGAANATTRAVSRTAGNIVMAAVEASADAIDDAPPGTDVSAKLNGKRPMRPRRDQGSAASTTCLTPAEFKADVAETAAAMKATGVPAVNVAAFECTLLNGYKKFIVREEGDKFCVRTNDFADWIVDVYLAALGGQLSK